MTVNDTGAGVFKMASINVKSKQQVMEEQIKEIEEIEEMGGKYAALPNSMKLAFQGKWDDMEPTYFATVDDINTRTSETHHAHHACFCWEP